VAACAAVWTIIAIVTRRTLLALSAAGIALAKLRLSRRQVSAITDEMAPTQADAISAARELGFEFVELRNVPETGKPFGSLSDPELKRWASELQASKLKVSVLHAANPSPSAAAILGAAETWPPVVGAWEPTDNWKSDWRFVRGTHINTVRVRAATLHTRDWKGILEMLQKDGYSGTLTVEKGDLESIRDLIHMIGMVA
jgi:sugar phosphate isomerase/epimerase